MKKAAAITDNDLFSTDIEKTSKNTRITQIERVTESFIFAGSKGFYQIEAYTSFQVTCLHSYISNLERNGIKFNRIWISHKNSSGYYTPFKRYWIADEQSFNNAVQLLNVQRAKRGLAPRNDIPEFKEINIKGDHL